MASLVTSLLAEVERERKHLNKISSRQLDSTSAKNSLRALVEKYFNDVRASLEASIEGSHLEAVDKAMQELLVLCHKRGSVPKYRELLQTVKENLVHLDSRLVSTVTRSGTNGAQNKVDPLIIETLKALLPSAALSYEQALLDLAHSNRLSWRGPATDLREALRETLDHLAPDDDVKASPGYKQEHDARGPTMKQKVRYIMRNRGVSKALSAPAEDASAAIDETMGNFVRSVYTRSSVSTHTPTEKVEVLRVLDLVRVVLSELLEVR